MPCRLPASDSETCSRARPRRRPTRCWSRVKERVAQPTHLAGAKRRTSRVHKTEGGARLWPKRPTPSRNWRRVLLPVEINRLLRVILDLAQPVKSVRADKVHALADYSCCPPRAVVRHRPK